MGEPLKEMFNERSVAALGEALAAFYPAFDRQGFVSSVFAEGWEALSLKERMRRITLLLHDFLPEAYREALAVLHSALPLLDADGRGFEMMVFPDFVEVYGLDDPGASLPALETFTTTISAEFAIRPFIEQYPAETMAQMRQWTEHPHEGVRRLASEGSRPRLPWGRALAAFKADPSPVLPILSQLRDDPSETVRRSVANNLNDIAKDNPDVVLAVLQQWQAEGWQHQGQMMGHALRTLVKAGHPGALALLGYERQPAVRVLNLAVLPREIEEGGEVTFSFTIESTGREAQQLMIDYVLQLVRAGGKTTEKVFKLSKRTLGPGEEIQIQKKHSFRPISTRRYYPGEHQIQPQINGTIFPGVSFYLKQEEENPPET